MPAVPCPACKQPMSDVAVVCPHCNARRPGVASGIAGKQLSPDEIRALVVLDAPPPEPTQGFLPTLVLPHPDTHGGARTAELALTVVTLPLVAAGAVSLALFRRKRRGDVAPTQGELVPVIAMAGLGGIGLAEILSLAGVPTGALIGVLVASIGALFARGVIRGRAASVRSRDLHRLARPEKAARPAKPPPARLVSGP